ncbi:MAG: hypothetical protein ACLRX6_03080 [Limosilactobacillus pontis]|uniref:hypothetical protein n=1 Tax=Limosilactobacillus pontis TaxID=35787 RepID=UPI0039A245E7
MPLSDIMQAHADAFRQKTGVTSKLSVVDMTKLLDDLKWGKENLLKGTSDQYKELKGSGFLGATTATSILVPASLGETFTYTATIKNTFGDTVDLQLWEHNGNNKRTKYLGSSDCVLPDEEKEVSVTGTIVSKECKYVECAIWAGNHVRQVSSIYVKDERLYIGTEPGVWTPNPTDKVGGVTDLNLTALPLRLGVAA